VAHTASTSSKIRSLLSAQKKKKKKKKDGSCIGAVMVESKVMLMAPTDGVATAANAMKSPDESSTPANATVVQDDLGTPMRTAS
jgi:hypothetical protein